MKTKYANGDKAFIIFAYIFVLIFALFCLLPFLLVIGGSLSDETAITKYGFSIIPRKFSLFAYKVLFETPAVLVRAYCVTISVTVIGTIASLFLMSMTAYVLHRRDFPYRNRFSFFIYFTTMFSGGLVPWYILIAHYLQLKNTLAVLILPSLLNVFHIIIIRTFMSSIPDSIIESAKIDGAGDFRIFIRLVIPLAKPVLATMGLFTALAYWNDWYLAMLFIDKDTMFPLQYYLYQLLSRLDFLKNVAASTMGDTGIQIDPPAESFKMATTIVTIGPIVLLYPFVQRYFVKGITIGAIKG